MVSALISRVVIIFGGMLYPSYRSYKAVRTKDVREYVKWMMYWIVFSIFCAVETIADVFVSFWCPFYYELKIIFVLYLLTPYTKGASVMYRKFIHPLLVRHERDIDAWLDQAKQESYHTLMRLGSNTIYSARDFIATTAVKGQAHLLQTLATRSQSLNDLSEDNVDSHAQVQYKRSRGAMVEEIREEEDEMLYEDDLDSSAHGRRRVVTSGYYNERGDMVEVEQFIDEQFNRVERAKDDDGDDDEEEEDGYAPVVERRKRAATAATSATIKAAGGGTKPPTGGSRSRSTHSRYEPGRAVPDGYATSSRMTRSQAAKGGQAQTAKRPLIGNDTFVSPNRPPAGSPLSPAMSDK